MITYLKNKILKCFPFKKNEYLNLANNLSSYTVKLLSNVRGRDELEIVLNKTGKEGEEKYERLARLDLALKYKEKPVNQKKIKIKYIISKTKF